MQTTGQIIHSFRLTLMAASLGLITALAACVDGGGGGLSGGSTIRGFVVSVDGSTSDVGGVAVAVTGTDLSTQTANDGLFVLSGVPPGSQQVQFSRAMTSGTYSTDVPSNSTVELRNVRLGNNRVQVDSVTVTENQAPDNSELIDNSGPGSQNSGSGSDSNDPEGSNSGSGESPDDDDSVDDDSEADPDSMEEPDSKDPDDDSGSSP